MIPTEPGAHSGTVDETQSVPSERELHVLVTDLGYTLDAVQVAELRSALERSRPVIATLRRDTPTEGERDPLRGDWTLHSRGGFRTGGDDDYLASPRSVQGSAVDAITDSLQRLRRADDALHCTVSFLDDRALEMAEESDRRIRSGDARPLEGIPFAVKDVIDVEGVPTTGGSLVENAGPAVRSAAAIARLERYGAIPISKDATTEFACGGPESPLTGVCANPWDRSRWAGGSSSGTAVAVATGAVSFGIGTDVGGSIRLPSAWCGVTGLKPTTGRVSRTGVVPMSWTAETVGPIARDARTIAAVLSAMAGHDPEDIRTGPHSSYDHNGVDPTTVRIAVPRDDVFLECDQEVLAGLERMAGVLRGLGMKTIDARIPSAHLANKIGYQVVFAEAASIHRGEFGSDRWEKYDRATVRRLSAGIATTAADYIRALQFRVRLQAEMMALFQDADLVLMPTVPAIAPKLPDLSLRVNGADYPAYEIQSNFTMICNLTGFPALAVPTGLSEEGCPVSAMLVAAPFREGTALQVAEHFQNATDFHLQPPPFPASSPFPST